MIRTRVGVERSRLDMFTKNPLRLRKQMKPLQRPTADVPKQ
jgi:hypothetical protein